MPKQNYFEKGQLTDVAYLILLTLVEPQHGYSIMSEIADMTDGREMIGPASLYTTLKRLSEANFIGLLKDSGTKKIYQITPEGLSALETEIEKRKRLAEYGIRSLIKYQEVENSKAEEEK